MKNSKIQSKKTKIMMSGHGVSTSPSGGSKVSPLIDVDLLLLLRAS
jgi:hypothetical protein